MTDTVAGGTAGVEELNAASFEIIASVGTARSMYIDAIRAARAGDFERAASLMKQGEEAYLKGHDAHMGLIQREAEGAPTPMNLMLTHAEDQLMSAESFGILAEEFIDTYKLMHKGNGKEG